MAKRALTPPALVDSARTRAQRSRKAGQDLDQVVGHIGNEVGLLAGIE
jgi:hypothetical protein